MVLFSLILTLLGCSAHKVGAGSGDSADSAPVDLDPMVSSYIPDNFGTMSPARVVFLGDSITAGYGASKRKLSYPRLLKENDDATWADAADLDFPGLYGADPDILDVSVPGATTGSLVGEQLPAVTSGLGDTVSGPTIVIATIAGNDVQAVMLSPDQADAAIASITANLTQFYDYFADPVRFPDGSFVYLANVYEPSDGVGQADECFYGLDLTSALGTLDKVNAATLAQAQDRGVAWIDMHGHFLGHGYHASDPTNPYYEAADPSLWFASDCIHPNDRGHHEIRRLFWYALAGQDFPGDVPEPG